MFYMRGRHRRPRQLGAKMTTRNCNSCLHDSLVSDVRGYDCAPIGDAGAVLKWCRTYAWPNEDGRPPIETAEACPGWADGEQQ